MDFQRLTITLDDNVFDADDGDNLLSSLLSEGADIRHGCRAGACRLYDLNNCTFILSCQTSISSSMALSTQISGASVAFFILTLNHLDESNVEVSLLGPSNDSFGDRVFVSVFLNDVIESVFVECIALNQAGAPLKVILQQDKYSKKDWQKVIKLSVNDLLHVQTLSGVRKGRLLYEMDLSDCVIVLVSSSNNGVFEPYWRDVLQGFSEHNIECLKLLSRTVSNPLQDNAFVSSFKKIVDKSERALQVIYHGQKLSEKDWEQVLNPLRI